MKRARGPAGLALAAAAGLAACGCGAGDAGPDALGDLGAGPLIRPDTPGNTLQFNFDPGDVVETHGSPAGSFLVHFTRQGPNAVPGADADASGVPDFVEQVALIYDEVLGFYTADLGFRAPVSDEGIADNGGDSRFDVYLVDFAGVGDGTFQIDGCDAMSTEICAGYMVQENDYAGYGYPSTTVANRILGSHELFHAVQAAYDRDQGSVLAEGTAVWATEQFDPALQDFEYFIDGYLDNCDRSLDVPLPGPVDPFSYGSAIFFQFLEERYGAGTVRALWERTENGAFGQDNPIWFEQLDAFFADRAQTSFAEAFVEFATWNMFTAGFADPTRGYADGDGYPRVHVDFVAAPYTDPLRVFYASAQYYRVPPEGRQAMTAALVTGADTPEELDGLVLLLVTARGGDYGPITRVADPAAGAEALDTSAADNLLVAVVSTLQEGDSRRPTLCIGDATEVAACKLEALAGGGTGGAGAAGGEAADEAEGCSCSAAGEAGSAGSGGLLAGALAALVRYTRRRRTR